MSSTAGIAQSAGAEEEEDAKFAVGKEIEESMLLSRNRSNGGIVRRNEVKTWSAFSFLSVLAITDLALVLLSPDRPNFDHAAV